ncbi:protein of unknown function DUF239 [Macleaya cordata]|uniref:Neprosin PEP catalytic domain-containing protein n=1 Tax=Macleaya cordata TaxID=56857 RepID=A0A200QDL0_MACCD|nr:protein of unknown function DUF239 [Macleaya cordata]
MGIYDLGWKGKICLLVLLAFAASSNGVDEKIKSKEKFLEVDMKLKLLNKPSLKSIQSEDGDIIDCVDIYQQPALDHPALRNHIIQMEPSFYPKTEWTMMKKNSSMQTISHIWQKNGSCPEGTIPIRRIRKQDLLRATSLENYGRKSPYITHSSNRSTERQESTNNTHNFEHLNQNGISNFLYVNRSAAFLITQGYSYIGAKGEINVWNPYVEGQDEYTTGQIWLVNGPRTGFESVESGWMVNPSVYGDTQTRFFIYWTVDGSHKTGCFDLICTGFVQINHEIALGTAIEPVSSEDGPQYEIPIFIFMDVNTSDWWLALEEKLVGYWPASLFGRLRHSAAIVQFGGEVYSTTIGKEGVPHTATAMGSGEDAQYMFGSAAYINHIRIIDYSRTERYPEWVYPYMDEPYCYSAYNYVQYIKEPEFYFGGRGRFRNPYCP